MSEPELIYDDRNLRALLEELQYERRRASFRRAFRRTGNALKRAAIANLRQKINSSPDLEKGIRVVVYKKVAGFKVSVVPKKANKKTGKGGKGYHTNRQGLQKPVLLWAEAGTKPRYTGRKTFLGRRNGRYTGRMPEMGFLGAARDSMAASLEGMLREEIVKSITDMAKRYGCK